MGFFREIWFLLAKEILLEWRLKYAISGILLYVVATIFIVHSAFIKLQPQVWNPIFWVIILFASVNGVAKSFTQESGSRRIYYFSLVSPAAIIVSKIIYNSLLVSLLAILTFLLLSFIADNPVKDFSLFFIAILLGSLGFSVIFTFVSSIASKASNSATLMAILSFPALIPMVMTLVKITASALRLLQDTSIDKDILILLSIDGILLSISLLLFPFLWRD